MSIRRAVSLGLGLVLAGCAGGSARSPAPEASEPTKAEVIQVVEALFTGMRTRDTAAVRTLLTPEATIIATGYRDQRPFTNIGTVDQFLTNIAKPGDTLYERMWAPEVRVDGNIAALWAPYDFRIGERFSHCGHDAFHLIRQDGRWQISAIAYTVREEECRR